MKSKQSFKLTTKTAIGLFLFLCGVGMMFFAETRGVGGFAIGFGMSVAVLGVTGNDNDSKNKRK
jgi:hypothetical protein